MSAHGGRARRGSAGSDGRRDATAPKRPPDRNVDGAVGPSVAVGAGPLNRQRGFAAWPPLDPGVFLDMNPSLVATASGERWVLFCRYPVPPRPGLGSIWAVRVDDAIRPLGRPSVLIGDGIDPRVVAVGDRIFVFYARLERDADQVIDGSCMALAEFSIEGGAWICSAAFSLPKFPLSGQRSAEAQDKWEKNWVPFPIDPDHVGLIYAHEPWDVITLEARAGQPPRLVDTYRSPGLVWDYGTIRGGTPPVPYDDGRLVTFFHAAQVVGSRRVYTVGACVFDDKPPYAPRLITADPLLIAPYSSGAHRFGWNFAGSVVFPAGATARRDGFVLVSGLDDGEVATFEVARSELAARLAPPQDVAGVTFRHMRGGEGASLPLAGLVGSPQGYAAPDDGPMVNFARILMERGRTFIDIGAQVGVFSMALAPRFTRVLAFEPDDMLRGWFERNRALNGYAHVSCAEGTPGEGATPALDARGIGDVDLVRLELLDPGLAVLSGAREILGTSQPVILCRTGTDPGIRPALEGFMREAGYSVEAIFPFAPAWVLCRPDGDPRALAWFV